MLNDRVSPEREMLRNVRISSVDAYYELYDSITKILNERKDGIPRFSDEFERIIRGTNRRRNSLNSTMAKMRMSIMPVF